MDRPTNTIEMLKVWLKAPTSTLSTQLDTNQIKALLEWIDELERECHIKQRKEDERDEEELLLP